MKVTVEKRGIGIGVALSGTDDNRIYPHYSEIRDFINNKDRETVAQVADIPGTYRIAVWSARRNAPTGSYAVRIVELRTATENDRALQEARRLTSEYEKHLISRKSSEARTLLERAINLREKALGVEHPEVAAFIHILALFLDRNSKDDSISALNLNT